MRSLGHRCGLEQRHIQVRQARAGIRAASQIAVSAQRRQRQTPAGLNHWFGLPSTTGPRERRIQRRPVGIARIAVAGTVRADLRREGEAAQQRRDAIELPAADELVGDPAVRMQLAAPNGSS